MVMKKRVLSICAVIAIVSALTISAFSASGYKQANLLYSDIKIKLNGQEITPKDVNGTVVEPFIIDGTTYLPVRALSGALGLEVDWDEATSTVILSDGGALDTSVGAGMYKVGEDIPAGTYKLTETGTYGGYWERSRDASGELDSIIANDIFEATAYVTVNNGEYLKLNNCTAVLQ